MRVAEWLRTSPDTIKRYVHEHQLVAIQIGRERRFRGRRRTRIHLTKERDGEKGEIVLAIDGHADQSYVGPVDCPFCWQDILESVAQANIPSGQLIRVGCATAFDRRYFHENESRLEPRAETSVTVARVLVRPTGPGNGQAAQANKSLPIQSGCEGSPSIPTSGHG